jgi:glycogen debranching enzyme
LFLIDMAWDLAPTGDKEFFLSMRDKMLATLEWMDRDGDGDGDGFYEYASKAGSWGEKNQGWKDSREAILYENGPAPCQAGPTASVGFPLKLRSLL